LPTHIPGSFLRLCLKPHGTDPRHYSITFRIGSSDNRTEWTNTTSPFIIFRLGSSDNRMSTGSRKTAIHTVMSSRFLLITRRRNACLHHRLGKQTNGTGESQCCRVSKMICTPVTLYQISIWKSSVVLRNFNQHILHSASPTVFRLSLYSQS
jgi:hypothetical protein